MCDCGATPRARAQRAREYRGRGDATSRQPRADRSAAILLSEPMTLFEPEFWPKLLEIAAINLVLSGDNAVVIALACRGLPPALRRKGVMLGSLGAIVLRVLLMFVAYRLLELPGLKLVGGLLLLWIALRMMLPHASGDAHMAVSATLSGAVKTVVVADFVMSLDNVLAVAAAAHGNPLLIVFGLGLSIPLIAWGSSIVLWALDRWPMLIAAGSGLLGHVATDMLLDDRLLPERISALNDIRYDPVAIVGGALVIALGLLLRARAAARSAHDAAHRPLAAAATADPAAAAAIDPADAATRGGESR